MQKVLVCTQDPVLAKRVRFLLGRDECHIEILTGPDALAPALGSDSYDLLVVSRSLEDQDVEDRLLSLGHDRPPTVVLGGEPIDRGDDIHVVADPGNAQAIYGLASRLLANGGNNGSVPVASLPAVGSNPPSSSPPASTSTDQSVDPGRLARTIHRHNAARDDGTLIVQGDEETWRLLFEDGRPVCMRSSRPGDRFGRHLVDIGRLSESDYAGATKLAIEAGLRLGEALIESRALTEDELRSERADYARIQLVERFAPDSGRFRFEAHPFDGEREFELAVLPVVAEGFKKFASSDLVTSIIGDRQQRYFRLRSDPSALQALFLLDGAELSFIEHGGRAYNVEDAAEVSGMSVEEALKLLALLWTCDKVEDFTPGVEEFEARIREERERSKDLGSELPSAALPGQDEPFDGHMTEGTPIFEAPVPIHTTDDPDNVAEIEPEAEAAPIPIGGSLPPQPSAPPPPPPADDVPAMPSAPPGMEQGVVEPMVFAAPGPRGPDGHLLETPERSKSRDHFQRGVQLLGQGQFGEAEQAFRESITLCSEEHIYLVGLARAVFYNPGYAAPDKLPVLNTIVSRAENLAPEDPRVTTLRSWLEQNQA
jgi:hypothetical protein